MLTACRQASSGITLRRLRVAGRARDFDRVVIVASLGRRTGIARGAELQADAMSRAGFDVTLLDGAPALRNPFHRVRHRPGTVYIFHCGGPQTLALIGSVLPAAVDAWRIGYWAWELPRLAPDWHGVDRSVDEIWTPSGFSADSLRAAMTKPVSVVPHRIASRTRRARGGEPLTVLAMADSRSSFARKNPEGALRAFADAFGDDPVGARLLLKLGGRPHEIDAFLSRHAALVARTGATVLREHLDEAGLDRLFDRTDVLLSLHRAEGFGLPMLEAMARGIPCIATGWSGNLAFMDDAVAALVPARLVPTVDDAGIYVDGTWADPDIAVATAHLRRLAADPGALDALALRAHARAMQLAEAPFVPPVLTVPPWGRTARI